jgi:hypothetical protein
MFTHALFHPTGIVAKNGKDARRTMLFCQVIGPSPSASEVAAKTSLALGLGAGSPALILSLVGSLC